jgi:recombinational DNA repair protein RecT
MAQKTVIRRILKLAPTSVQLNSALSFDEAEQYDGQNLEVIGRAAMVEANIDTNVFEIQQSSSQADKLVDKISSMGE